MAASSIATLLHVCSKFGDEFELSRRSAENQESERAGFQLFAGLRESLAAN